jgi:hypothetical protein
VPCAKVRELPNGSAAANTVSPSCTVSALPIVAGTRSPSELAFRQFYPQNAES